MTDTELLQIIFALLTADTLALCWVIATLFEMKKRR